MIEDRKGAARASHTPFTPVLVALLGLLLGCGAEPQSKPEPRERALGDLTGSWQLFVDDYLVEEKVQVKRTYHPLQKDPRNPILVSKGPWREQRTIPYGTVLPGSDGKGYRMWYDVWDGDCHNFYATSSDGISWTKPSLGLVEHEGSKDNNLLFRRSRLDHMPQVIHTPWEQDPQYHYKLINFDFGRSPPDHAVIGYWGAFSADGIHWKETDRNPVLPDFGDVGHFLWDPYGGRYLGYPKMFAAVRGFSRRSVGVSSSTDFKQWTPAELVLVPDEWDDRWVTEYKQHTDFYGLTVFPYQSMYLGFLWIFRITNGESDGPIFCELVSSRDSINWRRSEGDRVPILPLGEAGSWDDGMVQTLNYPLLEHDTIKVFYGGFDQTHGFRIGRSGVGVATLRKDGFVSLEAGSATGTVTTKPLKNLESELRLNANAEGGEIRVELLDEDGAIVSGFASTDCEPLEQDGVDQKVSWGPEHDLIPASDKPRRLRFVMRNASLYSFGAGPNVGRASVPIPTEASFTFESDQGRIAGDELIRDGVQRGLLHDGVSIVTDPENAVQGSSALAFQGASRTLNTFEIEGTSHLGDRFTLAAWVKSPNRKLTRLFSTYRGSGEPAAGELIFDFNPISGVLRLVLNGQRVQSRPQSWLDERYHHFAATYSRGSVKLYLNGTQVGEGRVRPGHSRLMSDGSVAEYFAPAGTESRVGIHLAANLRIGEDQGGRFIFHGQEALASNQEQLVGFVDNVLVAKRVLADSEIRALVSQPASGQEDRKVSDNTSGAGLEAAKDSRKPPEPKRIAAIMTTFFPNSHAGVLVDKFLRGFPTDEGLIPPRTEIASLYIDQIHERDIGRQIAQEFDIPLYESIRAALTLGGDKLAVDAVLLIGEHGDYPRSELGQEMLPRRYFFEQIAGVIGEAGRPIPIYNDKHLSYRWDDAQWMYETARDMKIPLWAGSALPVVWRKPNWEHPQGQGVQQALVIGFHMVERYGFHALEVLQSQVERRAGGETGVQSVQYLLGNDVWRAGDEGIWSPPLANAALSRIEGGPASLDPKQVDAPHLFLIEYVDGLKASVLMLGDGYVSKFAYAQQRGDTIDSLEYHTDSGPARAAFGYLGLNIEDFFVSGVPPSPVERTYLTTGILEAAMISRGRGGEPVQTPHLAAIRYQPDGTARRPTNSRPSGASIAEWTILEPGATSAAQSIPSKRDGTIRGSRRIGN